LTRAYRTSDKMAVKAAVVFDSNWHTGGRPSFRNRHNVAERKNQLSSPGAAPSLKTKRLHQKYWEAM